ncbi:hypothetical protein F5I97DRAFT_1872832 [Phlebopus sp. FC_14]|nr:hypothetical protein F5I97DRAFT_1872832 [Phlebopus sp. FC_14]
MPLGPAGMLHLHTVFAAPFQTSHWVITTTAVARNEVASPLPASSSLAALDAAAKKTQCDLIITLTSADDSMSFLDTSFSAVPPFSNMVSKIDNDDEDDGMYLSATRARAIVKPSRRL